jgi:hypothetical protein
MVRVATSIAAISSGRPMTPSSITAITSSGVPSIWTCSPGRAAIVGVNTPSGLAAVCRRVTADPNVCRPVDSASSSR